MGRKAVDFLYEKGHRTVAFLRNNESDYDRRSGYVILFRESLLAHAKERGMTIIESEHYEEDSFDAKRFVRTIFARPDRPSAIINQANAGVLSQVLVELHDNGMTIPQDVRCCRAARISRASPTTLPHHRNAGHAGGTVRRSVNLLTSAIEERADINGSVKLIEPALKRRGSVAEAGSGGTQ